MGDDNKVFAKASYPNSILLNFARSLIILFALSPFALGDTLDTYTRDKISLNGEWRYIVDPYENGFYNYRWIKFDDHNPPSKNAFYMDAKVTSQSELLEYDFDHGGTIEVPSDWNTQDPRLYFYEGNVWYRKLFARPKQTKNDRVFLKFGAVNYRSDVYLNGNKLGVHKGGFTPFHYEITDALRDGSNSLVLKVDNRRAADEVPTLNTDWWNYGGITRDVEVVVVPKTFIQHYQLKLVSVDSGQLDVKVKINSRGKPKREMVSFSIPELNVKKQVKTNKQGFAHFSFPLPQFTPWSPDNPKRYDIEIKNNADTLVDTVGLRTIETRNKDIVLNGETLFLRGISIHEEFAVDGGGRVKNAKQARYLLEQAATLNANFVRLAHYPHSEHAIRIAEEMGLLVWSEIPVYWTISWENPDTYAVAEQQLTEMITRDWNRASVIIWSIANETPVDQKRNDFLAKLATKARELDDSRLISAAMEKHYAKDDPNLAVITDPLSEIVDVVSFNQYIGWYEGPSEKLERTRWHVPYNKPVIVSEFGGGAKYGLRGDTKTRWTEEFQADIYSKTLAMLSTIDGWAGVSPWILMDFRSPRRIHGYYQNDFNRKGLLSETGEKKLAHAVLQKFYQEKQQQTITTAQSH